jgi:hypothetical protein
MFRRAVLGFLPAFLALAILCGTPATSIGGPEASATSWDAPAPVVRGSLTQDIPDISVNQSADEDDTPDDRIVRVASTIVWPDPAIGAPLLHASDRAGRGHRPCAAPARAPPIA